MTDATQDTRREMIAAGQPVANLAAGQGQTWTTAELTRYFEVQGYLPPFVVVRRRVARRDRQPRIHRQPAGLLRVEGGCMIQLTAAEHVAGLAFLLSCLAFAVKHAVLRQIGRSR
jgi:hypothetical protein